MADALIIGGGPAGLMAAEVLSEQGLAVAVYDAMPGVGRKLLRAGVGGLNLTHSEAPEDFLERYGAARPQVAAWLKDFDAAAVRRWAAGLGVETFVGSSGRVFPRDMKAAPLLRAWLRRLAARGVSFFTRHRWQGWDADGRLCFATPQGLVKLGAGEAAPAVPLILALGGGSWPRLGSDGAWVDFLAARGIAVAPLRPANCGFEVAWSAHLRERHAGVPLKNIVIEFAGRRQPGDLLISRHGIEGGPVYALSAPLREAIARDGEAWLHLDLLPDRQVAWLAAELARPRGRDSLANHLRRRVGIHGAKAALLWETWAAQECQDGAALAARLKALPLRLCAPRPLAEAISSAGGVRFAGLTDGLMLRQLPGVYCVGEMLDWEAPTGGYLLTACLASGRHAARAILRRSSPFILQTSLQATEDTEKARGLG